MPENKTKTCIYCGKDDSQAPLVKFKYQGGKFLICTEHFPILIHNPGKLSGILPNAEKLTPADHD